jgi:hypothetical protein
MPSTRRTALASLTSLAAVPLAAVAHAGEPPDPIMPAIAHHRAAFAAFEAVPSPAAGDFGPTSPWSVAGNANREAAEALASTVPTTMQGVVALLDYLHDFERLLPPIDWHDGLPDGFEAAGARLALPIRVGSP